MKPTTLTQIAHYNFSLLLIFMFSMSIGYGQNSLKLSQVKEVDLPEEVKKAVFDFSENGTVVKEKIKIYDRKVVFFDNDGNVIATRIYDGRIGVNISDNHRFLEIWRHTTPPTKSTTGINTVEILNNKGKVLWSKDFDFYPEGLSPYLILSNAGTAVEIDVPSGKLNFYDKSGRKINEIRFSDISESRGESVEGFSNDGKLFVFGLAQRISPIRQREIDRHNSRNRQIDRENLFKNMKSDVIAFSPTGDELWRFRMDERRISNIFLSPNDRYLVCTGTGPGLQDKTTYILDMSTGNLLLKEIGVGAQQVEFFDNNDHQYVVVNDLSSRLVNVNISTKRVDNIYTPSSDKKILGMDVDENTQKIALIEARTGFEPMQRGQRAILADYKLKILDSSGNLLTEGELPVDSMGFLQREDFMKFENETLILYLSKSKKLRVFDVPK